MRVIIVKIVISELEGITSPTKAEISGIEASIIIAVITKQITTMTLVLLGQTMNLVYLVFINNY
jgi:hypothetical protein